MEKERAVAPERRAAVRRVLWASDLRERWGVSLCTLWRWRRGGRMPEPDFMGSGWTLDQIEEFERGGLRPAREPGLPPRSRPAVVAKHK